MVRKAKVDDPTQLAGLGCLEVCLSVQYLSDTPSALVDDAGLVAAEDGDEDAVRNFADLNELQDHSDAVVAKLH